MISSPLKSLECPKKKKKKQRSRGNWLKRVMSSHASGLQGKRCSDVVDVFSPPCFVCASKPSESQWWHSFTVECIRRPWKILFQAYMFFSLQRKDGSDEDSKTDKQMNVCILYREDFSFGKKSITYTDLRASFFRSFWCLRWKRSVEKPSRRTLKTSSRRTRWLQEKDHLEKGSFSWETQSFAHSSSLVFLIHLRNMFEEDCTPFLGEDDHLL